MKFTLGPAAGLQPGGVQEAINVLTPAPGVVTAAPPLAVVAAVGTKLENVIGALVMGCPRMSVTSAAKVSEVPEATLNDVSVAPERWSEILPGGHATKTPGVPAVLDTAPTEATTVVAPGSCEVTTPFASTVATVEFPVPHVNGPTLELMS